MSLLMTLLAGLSSVILIVLTVVSIFTLRKPRKITVLGTLLSGVIAGLSLLVIVVLGGMRLNLLLALPILLVGMLLGFVRGQMVRFSPQGKIIIGRNSVLLAVLWGGSMAVSLLLGLLGWPLLASLGLVPVVLSTGLQLGYSANHFLRRTAVLLGAGSSGISSMLNLGPDPRMQTKPPDPQAQAKQSAPQMQAAARVPGKPPAPAPPPEKQKKKKGWIVVLVILMVGACLAVTALVLLGSLWWLMV